MLEMAHGHSIDQIGSLALQATAGDATMCIAPCKLGVQLYSESAFFRTCHRVTVRDPNEGRGATHRKIHHEQAREENAVHSTDEVAIAGLLEYSAKNSTAGTNKKYDRNQNEWKGLYREPRLVELPAMNESVGPPLLTRQRVVAASATHQRTAHSGAKTCRLNAAADMTLSNAVTIGGHENRNVLCIARKSWQV